MLSFTKNSMGKLLQLFFRDPDKEYYLREIGQYLKKEPGVFQRSLQKLVNDGILTDRRSANLRYFQLNKKYPLYNEIKRIVSKTLGLELELKKLIDSLKGVEIAYVFGSVAKNTENSMSDIDLMLIGKIDQIKIMEKIRKTEDVIGREINYHIFDKEEIIRKLGNKNDFLMHIFNNPIILLKGNINEFRKTT